jgi:hypothetical protein
MIWKWFICNSLKTAASPICRDGIFLDWNRIVNDADSVNHIIQMLTPAGSVSTLARSRIDSVADSIGTAASPMCCYGNIVVWYWIVNDADSVNPFIQMLTPAGSVSTFAWSELDSFVKSIGTAASPVCCFGIIVDWNEVGNIADSVNHIIQMLTPAGSASTLARSSIDLTLKSITSILRHLRRQCHYPCCVGIGFIC